MTSSKITTKKDSKPAGVKAGGGGGGGRDGGGGGDAAGDVADTTLANARHDRGRASSDVTLGTFAGTGSLSPANRCKDGTMSAMMTIWYNKPEPHELTAVGKAARPKHSNN
ncbi:hypothetical protein LTR53_015738 [Teratosphaeriaceae sp. CCFEE 6253]|nr:hypothetical protein LTR53_015738 [Teratosphaeriaceae sp. CCFEE 6253]